MIFLLFIPIFAFTAACLYLVLWRKAPCGPESKRMANAPTASRDRARRIMEDPALQPRR